MRSPNGLVRDITIHNTSVEKSGGDKVENYK